MKRNRSVFSRVLFFIIFFSIIRNVFLAGDSEEGLLFGFPIVWVVVFFGGLSLFSSFVQNKERSQRQSRETKKVEPFRTEKEEKKSEYDFDDEFAIDPRDYE